MWHFKTEHDTCWCRRLLPADGCESFQLGAARRPLPPELSWAVVILGQAQWALRVPPITQVKSEDPQASWPWAGCFPCHSRARPGWASGSLACLSQELQPKAQAASCLLLQPNCSWIQFKLRLEVNGRRLCTAPGGLHRPHGPQSGRSQAPAQIVAPVIPFSPNPRCSEGCKLWTLHAGQRSSASQKGH